MSVGEVCNREVVITDPDDSILSVSRLMRDYHVGDAVVVEESNGERVPIGILTDRDIVVDLLANDVDLDTITVGDVMSRDLLVIGEEDSLEYAIKRMRDRGVRRAPVVNHRGGLEGILAVDDILDLLTEQLTDLDKLFRREQKHERESRRAF